MARHRNGSRFPNANDESISDQEKLTPLQEALLIEAGRDITIVSNGQTQTLSMEEVLIRKLAQSAAAGGQHAMSTVIRHINKAQQIQQQKIDDDVAFGRKLKAMQEQEMRKVLQRGGDPDTVLPHPDDVVVEEGVGYHLIGPVDAEDLRRVKRDCAWRDAIILQVALEDRLGPLPTTPGQPPSKHTSGDSALLVLQFVNNDLPQRFRKSDAQVTFELMRYEGVSKRELLKRSHRAWAALGCVKPRGWRLPPLEALTGMLHRVVPAMVALLPEVKAGKLSADAIAKRFERMIGPEPFW